MNRRYLRATVVAASVFATLFAGVTWQPPEPRFLWNASASAPIGLYRVDPLAAPAHGDLVAIVPPPPVARFLGSRGYLPRGVPLLKRVAAMRGALICRSGTFVTVDGVAVARALARDRAHRPLPVWSGCRTVGHNELFLINAASGSLDGRYFGPVSAAGLIGIARPLLTRSHPAAPLHWHRGGISEAFKPKWRMNDDHRNHGRRHIRGLYRLDQDARVRRTDIARESTQLR